MSHGADGHAGVLAWDGEASIEELAAHAMDEELSQIDVRVAGLFQILQDQWGPPTCAR